MFFYVIVCIYYNCVPSSSIMEKKIYLTNIVINDLCLLKGGIISVGVNFISYQ